MSRTVWRDAGLPAITIRLSEFGCSAEQSTAPVRVSTDHFNREEKMSINQLVYISQAVRKMSSEDLTAIHRTAKANNELIDVTGSLFYNGGWFLQVLEGPVATITGLYQKIEGDPRHKNSRLLYNEPAKFRTFTR